MSYGDQNDDSHLATYTITFKHKDMPLNIITTLSSSPPPPGLTITEQQRDQVIQDFVDLINQSSEFELINPFGSTKFWNVTQYITPTLTEV